MRRYVTDDLDATRADLLRARLVGYAAAELRQDEGFRAAGHDVRRKVAVLVVERAMREVGR